VTVFAVICEKSEMNALLQRLLMSNFGLRESAIVDEICHLPANVRRSDVGARDRGTFSFSALSALGLIAKMTEADLPRSVATVVIQKAFL